MTDNDVKLIIMRETITAQNDAMIQMRDDIHQLYVIISHIMKYADGTMEDCDKNPIYAIIDEKMKRAW